MNVERPTGVTALAAVFMLAATYLLVVGRTMLTRPGVVSMAAGAAFSAASNSPVRTCFYLCQKWSGGGKYIIYQGITYTGIII